MTTDTPLVSICIPTYNRAGMVEKAIASALAQTYQNIEVIVVDNASTDNTREVMQQFANPRLSYHVNEKNLGLFGNFNRCIQLAQGEYIHILHSDDSIDNEFTEKCMQFFRAHPTVKMTTTSSRIVRDESTQNISYADRDLVFSAPDGLRNLLRERSFIICPSVTIHRGVYQDVGEYSLEYPYSSDLYQWFRIARKYDIGFVSGAWLNYRQGEHSESHRLLFSDPSGYLDTMKILVRMVAELGEERVLYNDEVNSAAHRTAGDCIYAGMVRIDTMREFSPFIFMGLAYTAWSLITPRTIRAFLSKTAMFFFIAFAGFMFCIRPLRLLVKKLMIRNEGGY